VDQYLGGIDLETFQVKWIKKEVVKSAGRSRRAWKNEGNLIYFPFHALSSAHFSNIMLLSSGT